MQVIYRVNEATEEDILGHLRAVSSLFTPSLVDRIDIEVYSWKIRKNALTFEAWDHDKVIGVIACYLNILHNEVYITNVSVLKEYQGMNIAQCLMRNLMHDKRIIDFRRLRLKVYDDNHKAISFYKKNGFVIFGKEDNQYEMVFPILKNI